MIQDKQSEKTKVRQAVGKAGRIDKQQKNQNDVNGSIYRPGKVPDGWILPDLRRYNVASSARSLPSTHTMHARCTTSKAAQTGMNREGRMRCGPAASSHAPTVATAARGRTQATGGGGGEEEQAKARAAVLLLWPGPASVLD